MSHKDEKVYEVLKACAYFTGAEVLFRMTKGAVFYESGKYIVILFCFLGMFYKGISGKAYPYFLYVLFLVPSIFVASTTLSFDANFRTNIAFVLSGPVCLGVAALFTYDKKISLKQLNNILLFIALPIISLAAYIYLYSPSLEDVLTNTASNRATSGGFGPNQVAMVLGLGMIVMVIRFFQNSKTTRYKILNLLIFAALGYRAIITFSRGGVWTAAAVILIFVISYYMYTNRKKKNEIIIMSFLLLGTVIGTWFVSSQNTQGFIDLRYANKDHLGRDKEDLTTGRLDLFLYEIEGFIVNPFVGIGSSRAKDQRLEIEGQGNISHSEVGRLLGEHGIFGIIILLILILRPIHFRSKNKSNLYFYSFIVFWFLTINHASMRIAAPSFVYALALLNVKFEKPTLHRKQLKA